MHKPVLFRVTNNLKVGGVQRRLRALLPLLMEHYEVHVVTYKDKGVFFDELADLGVQTHFLPRKGHWNPVAIWRLARLLRKHKADIVHTHSFGGNVSGILAAALARVPVRVGQVHSRGLHWYGASLFRQWKQIVEEAVIHRLFSHQIVFVSEESLSYFQSKTKLSAAKLSVLHNGLSLIGSEAPFSRKDFKLPASVPVIGFVGRLTQGKGLEYFFNFAAQALNARPGAYHFAVIGGGDQSSYNEICTKLGISHSVTFTGELREMERVYPLLNALLFTSEPEHEGMPGVVLEACAHGLPILARESLPIQEISRHFSRIRYFNNADASLQLEQLLSTPPANQDTFLNEFSLEAMRKRTHELYQRLLVERNQGGLRQ
jgi:glycosyltransferase involved in cell wall biosynthesis